MKRSALYHSHLRAGATLADRHGWAVPSAFSGAAEEAAAVRRSVGISDLSFLRKFESPVQHEGSWKLGSRRYLIAGEPPVEAPPGGMDITGIYAAFLLTGPRSRDVLSKLTSLNLTDSALASRSCGQANVAHAPAIVLREDIVSRDAAGVLRSYTILVSREYGESVWESILHAGHEFHIVPFGSEALDSLRS